LLKGEVVLIPKIIHLIWIGEKEMPLLYKRCIESWERFAPGYEVMFWNNDNIPKNDPFINRMINERKYAFASDYLRCLVLEQYGGIYFDADIELVNSIDQLCSNHCFLGYESLDRVANGVMGAIPNHWFIHKLGHKIKDSSKLKAIPLHTTELLKENGMLTLDIATKFNSIMVKDVTIYHSSYFYPYNPYDKSKGVSQLLFSDIKPHTIAIHHWAKQWNISLYDKFVGKLKGIFKNGK
jgi:hypothetical protein